MPETETKSQQQNVKNKLAELPLARSSHAQPRREFVSPGERVHSCSLVIPNGVRNLLFVPSGAKRKADSSTPRCSARNDYARRTEATHAGNRHQTATTKSEKQTHRAPLPTLKPRSAQARAASLLFRSGREWRQEGRSGARIERELNRDEQDRQDGGIVIDLPLPLLRKEGSCPS